MSQFLIRPYKNGDEGSINRGFNQTFGLNRSLEEWYWKFKPDQLGSHITVAVNENDEVIAHFAAVRVPLQMNGREWKVGHAVDLYCLRRPEAVQQRLFIKTAREFFRLFGSSQRMPLLYGFPGKISLRLGQLKLDYAHPALVHLWSRPITFPRPKIGLKQYQIQTQFCAQASERLWHRARSRYAAAVVRNGAWITRRYLSRPNNPYSYISVYKDKEIHAWGVLLPDNITSQWVDLVWDGEDPEALISLNDAIARTAYHNGARRLEMWLSGDAKAEAILQTKGWIKNEHPQSLHLSARRFDPTIDERNCLQRFYLTMGTSDLF